MTTTAVWTERNELHAPGYRDCAYSAALTSLVYGGWRGYPLGMWSAQEREALERSDNQPDETGASVDDLDVAVQRRYGLGLRHLYDSIGDALGQPDQILILGGSYAGLPAGHPLRRWQPGFTGAHMVAVRCGAIRWYDPLAPNQYAGDAATAADVLRFAYGQPNVRLVREDEYLPLNPPDTGTGGTAPAMPDGLKLTDGGSFSGRVTIRAGAPYYPLTGAAGGTLPEVTKRAFCTGYSPALNKRLYVIEDEFAGVDVNDVTAVDLDPVIGVPPAPAAVRLVPGLYVVP